MLGGKNMNIQDVFNNESLYSKREFKLFTLDEDKLRLQKNCLNILALIMIKS